MDQAIRNKLRNVVTQCRKLLEEAVAQVLQGQFGIHASGKKDEIHVEDEARMKNLSDEDKGYRRDIQAHLGHIEALGYKPKDALAQLVREIAFTHLNRLCAYKMMEAREVWIGGQRFREAVSRGLKSQGFQFYLADHSEDKKRFDSGHQDVAYRHFLAWLGALLSEEIGVLFSPTDPVNRLFPPQRVLDDVLALLNSDDLTDIWSQDETIGWVYQYFTPKELRDQARKESAAPRNSYELAFRNQFFTPRYVVEFLTDNTLGRIWYEMRKGDTKLKGQCRYLVRRPSEVFLAEGQMPPEPTQNQGELSQEELLKQPVHILYRRKKDPRELRILDPACGSGHFLLYCFDLLLTIYEEAYADPDLGPKLKEEYPTPDALRREIPRLILAHNLHGIDIDLRCTQIAALALWLRCQRAYREMGLKQDRPKITRSNIVCAEPMPGEREMLDEFLKTLKQDRLEALIGRVMKVPEGTRVRATQSMVESLTELVRLVWDKMQLAGEAGSLLKIEEALQEAVRKGQEEWEEKQPLFRFTEFSLTENPKESYVRIVPGEGVSFWQRAEVLVLEALKDYTLHAANGVWLPRQLFAEDAAQGFAFIDICRKRFDVALMNPPFGSGTAASKDIIETSFPDAKNDLYAAFVMFGLGKAQDNCGYVGAITSRAFVAGRYMRRYRNALIPQTEERKTAKLFHFVDLGQAVLDEAVVESCCYVTGWAQHSTIGFRNLRRVPRTSLRKLLEGDAATFTWKPPRFFDRLPMRQFFYELSDEQVDLLNSDKKFEPIIGRVTKGLSTCSDERFVRCFWEVPPHEIYKRWFPLVKGGDYSWLTGTPHLVIDYEDNGKRLAEFNKEIGGNVARSRQSSKYYFLPAVTWSRRSNKGFSARRLRAKCIFADKSPVVVPKSTWDLPWIAPVLMSDLYYELVEEQAKFGSYETSAVKGLPVPSGSIRSSTSAWQPIYSLIDQSEYGDDASWLFSSVNFTDDKPAALFTAAIDKLDAALQSQGFSISDSAKALAIGSVESEAWNPIGMKTSSALGYLLGRWDIRYATGQLLSPSVADPFASLPSCPLGTLLGPDGLPAREIPKEYPLRVMWEGIMPDDPGHSDDIIRGVREVCELIWKDRAEATEKEACDFFGVKELRDYFRKSGKGGFWDDHVARYSKSRRKAPIYWLLQSSKKNYALWVYYHRLDKDILFKALLNYVEPKIRLEQSRLDSLRLQKTALGAAKGAKKIDKDIERQEALLGEIKDFEERLRRAANLDFGKNLDSSVIYDPDLNDGVVLNIAPLWELVPWKEAKGYWEELLAGEYEWSSMGKLLRKKGLVK